jgi:DNA-binding HxlR family transcriptional regulator
MKSGKITKWYDDACGTAHALELVGERWALLIMRELMFGPRRFSDLKRSLPGISANVLTQRLEGLEAAGILTRKKLPPPASVQVYELTAWGYEAESVIGALGRWAARSPRHDPTLPLSPASVMLSLKTMFVAERAGSVRLTASFRFETEVYRLAIRDGAIDIVRGEAAAADLAFDGTPEGLAALVYGDAPPELLEQAGTLRISGDAGHVARFTSLFALPDKAG